MILAVLVLILAELKNPHNSEFRAQMELLQESRKIRLLLEEKMN